MAYTNVDRLCSFYIIPYTARMASNTAYCTTVRHCDRKTAHSLSTFV